MTEREYLEWIADWMMETGSLLFWRNGSCGDQPILLPLYYPWWLDDDPTSLHEDAEGRGGRRRHAFVN